MVHGIWAGTVAWETNNLFKIIETQQCVPLCLFFLSVCLPA